MSEKELRILADSFGSICEYSPQDEEVSKNDWCWEHCGDVEIWECWKRWFEIRKLLRK